MPRSSADYVLSRVTQHNLQRNLQKAVTCAGLGVVHMRPSCELRPAAASARPGAIE